MKRNKHPISRVLDLYSSAACVPAAYLACFVGAWGGSTALMSAGFGMAASAIYMAWRGVKVDNKEAE